MYTVFNHSLLQGMYIRNAWNKQTALKKIIDFLNSLKRYIIMLNKY